MLILGAGLSMILNLILIFFFYGLAQIEVDVGLGLTWITGIITLGIGIASVKIAKRMKKGTLKEKASLILLILGIVAAVGVFIELLPARTIATGGSLTNTFLAVTLTTNLLFIDPYLIMLGGVVDLLAVPPEIIAEAKKNNSK